MQLPQFTYHEPTTVKEACSLLSHYKEEAKVLAGGTDLLVLMKQRVATPQHVVNLKAIPGLSLIKEEKDRLRVGALTTLWDLRTSPVVQQRFPILAQAAASVAIQQIQTTATLGGNICLDAKCWFFNQSHIWRKSREACFKRGGQVCHVMKGGKRCYAVLSGDTIPALIALNATIEVASARGTKSLPLDALYTGKGETPNLLEPDDMVTEIQLPFLPTRTTAAFAKHSIRAALEFAVADVACVVTGNGTCEDARIVIGSVGPRVVRANEAEELLKGKALTADLLNEVGKAAVKGVRLVSGAQHSVYYRRKIIEALTKRVVLQASQGGAA
jgi:4-hydroxybenzoyl-CoA reductase beta subunit